MHSLFVLTREQLYEDLYQAYLDARRHKRNKPYQIRFESRLEYNLQSLCEDLFSRTYKAKPSTCFIITDPKKREVFAADFRDRIVHHLYYNYTRQLYERTFIQDTYSCIPKRGTHYGIKRLQRHILQESENFTRPCYVLKMDISGYFMHIDRKILLDLCLNTLHKMASHRVSRHREECWQDVLDMDFLKYLTREIVLLNPIDSCRRKGSVHDWDDLPHGKSLFYSPHGCGLPIGNLTSQLFSNVYLNVLDQFVKRVLKCRHYGRYVDDFYIVSCDKKMLENYVDRIRETLRTCLHLRINEGKTKMVSVWKGVDFLGMYIKPHRSYITRSSLSRMKVKVNSLSLLPFDKACSAKVSFMGVLSHGSNYNILRLLGMD